MPEKRIYVVVAETVQTKLGNIVQPCGRAAAQVAHVVSQMRASEAVYEPRLLPLSLVKPFEPITTIILAAKDSESLRAAGRAIAYADVHLYAFHDTNDPVYGEGEKVLTAVCTTPVELGKLGDALTHLPLWSHSSGARLEPAPAQMKDEQAVKAVYPEAVCERLPDTMYAIWKSPQDHPEGCLAIGNTEQEAWYNLRRRLASTGAESISWLDEQCPHFYAIGNPPRKRRDCPLCEGSDGDPRMSVSETTPQQSPAQEQGAVTRYDTFQGSLEDGQSIMNAESDGEWVRYEDYATLRAERDALKLLLQRVADRAEAMYELADEELQDAIYAALSRDDAGAGMEAKCQS